MFGDGLSKRGALLEQSYACESDRRLLEQGRAESKREAEIQAIRDASQITDQQVLTELIDCGVRAESMHLLTLVPLVHVAWANGHIQDQERLAILQAAEEEGIRSDSPSFALLDGWLHKRPDRLLLKTWKDYVAAIRLFVSPASYVALQVTTVSRAWKVAEAAGGILGFHKVSRAEEAAIEELNLAFYQ